MNEFLFGNLVPKLENLSARISKLETNQKAVPQLEITIESTDCDDLISQIQKLYQNFSGGTNLKISVTLKEL